MVVTLLRGFKVSISTLDAFLAANGVDETYATHPSMDPHKLMARVIIPQRKFMERATIAYVAYAWVMSFAQREIQLAIELPESAPPAFETLRREILGADNADEAGVGKMGLFLVVTDEGRYTPEVMKQRFEVPQHCDQCDESFDLPQAWYMRQDHRRQVHGASEGNEPLPEA